MARAAAVISQRITPMAYGDMWEAEKSLGLKQGTTVSIEAFFGASVNTYGDRTQYREGTAEERQEQFAKDLKRMKWDGPDLPYTEFLTQAQRQKMSDRRRVVQGLVIYSGAALPPELKEDESDEKFQKRVKKHTKAFAKLQEMRETIRPTKKEAQELLVAYIRRDGKSEYKVVDGKETSHFTPGFDERLDRLEEIYGVSP
jgi:hypothetical protein